MTNNRYTAAVFDLDGTLLDTLEDLYLATNQALERHGLPLRTREEVRMFVGNGVEMLIRRAVPAGTCEDTVASVLADFKAIYAAICEDHTAPYEGILNLLTALREQGIRVAVVSNKFDAAVRDLCAHYFGGLVEVAVGESPEVPKKPAPDTVYRAMRLLGVAPADCVYVGDSDVDIRTAENAGIPCISVLWGFRDREHLLANGASAFAESTDALAALL